MKRWRLLPAALTASAGLGTMAWLLAISFDRKFYHGLSSPGDWTHPTGTVLLFLGFTLVEACFATVILYVFADGRLWKAALIGMAPLAPWAVLHMMIGMHAPGFIYAHLAWLVALVVWLAVLLVASVLSHALRAFGDRAASPRNR